MFGFRPRRAVSLRVWSGLRAVAAQVWLQHRYGAGQRCAFDGWMGFRSRPRAQTARVFPCHREPVGRDGVRHFRSYRHDPTVSRRGTDAIPLPGGSTPSPRPFLLTHGTHRTRRAGGARPRRRYPWLLACQAEGLGVFANALDPGDEGFGGLDEPPGVLTRPRPRNDPVNITSPGSKSRPVAGHRGAIGRRKAEVRPVRTAPLPSGCLS